MNASTPEIPNAASSTATAASTAPAATTATAASTDATTPPPSGSPATDFAVRLLAELEARGVRDLVVSPGSRSQALALAAAEYERAGRLRLHVRLDERSAGFLALGLAVESGTPAALVTTSGTAVANLHPAVLEAHHSGVPMLLLTADRPQELRGIGSNQTTHQPRLFGEALRLVVDVDAPVDSAVDVSAVRSLARQAVSAALGRSSISRGSAAPGPVQLNIAFREPLSAPVTSLPERVGGFETGAVGHPDPAPSLVDHTSKAEAPVPDAERGNAERGDAERGNTEGGNAEGVNAERGDAAPNTLALAIDAVPGTVVIAGHAAGPLAETTARLIGAPLVAEVSSGARFGPNLVPSYRQMLDDPQFGGRVRRAIVFGHPTLTRQVPQLLKRPDVEVIVVRGGVPEAYDPSRSARIVDGVSVIEGAPDRDVSTADDSAHREWIGRWVHTGRSLVVDDEPAPDLRAATSADAADQRAFLAGEVAAIRRPVTRRSLVEALWRVTWPHDRLVLGASRLIREADVFVGGKKVAVHANRGLAGIDGTIATATGIGLASQSGAPVTAGRPGAGWADATNGITRVLVGDLTLLHDAGSLLFGQGEAKPRLQVIVGNDGGGTIFDGLEVAGVAAADAMTRVQLTPQNASFEQLAAAYGWEYVRVATRGELDQALVGSSGPVLIEVPLARVEGAPANVE